MFPQVNSVANGLQLFDADMTSLTGKLLAPGLGVMADHSLTMDFQCPQSPNSQYMYETDSNAIITNCSSGVIKQSPSTSQLSLGQYPDYDVISPSVEGLTFDSSDFLSFNGRGDNLLTVGVNELPKSDENVLKLIDNGPTLTQLNTEDLESNFFDEFNGLGEFGTDPMMFDCMRSTNREREQPMKYSSCTVTAPQSPSLMAPSSNWPQRTVFVGTPIVFSNLIGSHLSGAATTVTNGFSFANNGVNATQVCQPAAAAATSLTVKRALSPQPDRKQSMLAAALSSPKTNVNWNWEEIESFLQSEGQRMATEASNSSSPVEPVAKKIKTEPVGEYCMF